MFRLSPDPGEVLSKIAWDKHLKTKDLVPMATIMDFIVQCRHDDVLLNRARETMLQCCGGNRSYFLGYKLAAIFTSRVFRDDIREHSLILFIRLLRDLDGNGTPLTHSEIVNYGKFLLSLPAINGGNFKFLTEAISLLASGMFSVIRARDWPDLRTYISSLLRVRFWGVLWFFHSLPVPLPEEFLNPLHDELYPRIQELLTAPIGDQHWIAAFSSGHALSVQMLSIGKADLAEAVMTSLVNSAANLVNPGNECAVRASLLYTEMFIRRTARDYDEKTYDFTNRFIGMIDGIHGIGILVKEVTGRMTTVLEEEFRSNRRVSIPLALFPIREAP